MSREEMEREKVKCHKAAFNGQHLEGIEFAMPAVSCLKTFVFGEIVSASDFEANNIYVNYIFQLSGSWSPTDTSQALYGTTHVCSTKPCRNTDVAHFTFPFSVEMILKLQDSNLEKFAWPRLFLEVWSQDFWKRYRLEGCGYLILPFSPGTYEFEIGMVRPVSESLQARLHQFFLGSGSELEGIVFSASPVNTSKQPKSALSSLGSYTEGSGKIKLRMNIIHQALEYIYDNKGRPSLNKFLQNLRPKTSEIDASIQTVLDAFHHARKKMQEAKENVPSNDVTLDKSHLTVNSNAHGSLCMTLTNNENKKTQKSPSSYINSNRTLQAASSINSKILNRYGKETLKQKKQLKMSSLQELSPSILSTTSSGLQQMTSSEIKNENLASSLALFSKERVCSLQTLTVPESTDSAMIFNEPSRYQRLQGINKELVLKSKQSAMKGKTKKHIENLDEFSNVNVNVLSDLRGSVSESAIQHVAQIRKAHFTSETEGKPKNSYSAGTSLRIRSESSRMRRRKKKGENFPSEGEITHD